MTSSEIEGGLITAGAGDAQNDIAEDDQDVLIDYVENNRVEIYGGSGFDTVVVAGTAIDDEFFIFTDNTNRQYLYGAGLKLENIDGIERLALLTGSGDDTVYLYGLDPALSLLINTGSGNDEIIIGGEERRFDVTYPESNAIYTVEQNLVVDDPYSENRYFNDIEMVRRDLANGRELALVDKQEIWRDFYKKWIVPDISDNDLAAVSISSKHWALLEANLAVAIKQYAQAIEKAASPFRVVPLRNTPSQWGASASKERQEFLDAMNRVEAQLQSTNKNRWDLQTVDAYGYSHGFLGLSYSVAYSSLMNLAINNDLAPVLPSKLDFGDLDTIAPSTNFSAAGLTLDRHMFNYLNFAVAHAVWGDMVRAEPVREGTGLFSPRVEQSFSASSTFWGFSVNWLRNTSFYEPDLFLGDLYGHQVPTGSGWLPHIQGEDGVWMPAYTDPRSVSDIEQPTALSGNSLFWDLLGMFYEMDAPAPDNKINVEQFKRTMIERGSASYRFDDLPERTVSKILPENYDITEIEGVLRIAGGLGDDDRVVINARDVGGVPTAFDVSVESQELRLGDFVFDNSALPVLPAGVEAIDVQDALSRAHKETQIGVLDDLADRNINNATVSIQVDTETNFYELSAPLDALDTAVDALDQALQSGTQPERALVANLQAFVDRGKIINGDKTLSSQADFSLDALDRLLNDVTLYELLDANAPANVAMPLAQATDVDNALKDLKRFLELTSVSNELERRRGLYLGRRTKRCASTTRTIRCFMI